MRHFLILLLAFYIQSSFGQITITSDNAPVPGSSYYMAIDDDPDNMIDPGLPGENILWDFRNLGEDYVDTLDFVLPNETPYGDWFPFANLAVYETDTSVGYLQTNNNRMAIIGAVAESEFIQENVKVDFEPAEIMMLFPTSYLTEFDTNHMLEFKAPYDQLPFVDSIRFRSYINKNQIADAWGDLKTPMGDYEALRVSISQHYTDTLWVRIFGSWTVQETDEYITNTFEWWSNEASVQGYPLAKLEFNDDLTSLFETQYMKGVPVSVQELQASLQTKVYPNPATDYIYIAGSAINHIRVFNIKGKLLFDHSLPGVDHYQTPIFQWPAGIYFYILQGAGGVSSGKIIVGK